MAKPFFAAAWAASQRIYSPTDSAEKVAQVVGGTVEINIRLPKNPWTNTCAVRMSYILNQTGTYIPATRGKTVTGKDKKNYFFRVRNLIDFLRQQWGSPEVIKYPPPDALAGRKGVILFEVSGWSDAGGHATLYDGYSCYDHCYFNEREAAYRTTKAHFWELP
ncbi:MAG: type VI secretion system amidase effector protein Tae4 [Betaproteobacteria bacterium]|nr:type VI secretion system amidase effector protein Tae4 [Betaproteobacteria bacterium]